MACAEETDIDLPSPPTVAASVDQELANARNAQRRWTETPIRERLRAINAVRRTLVEDPMAWADAITAGRSRTVADSLAAEVLPLADACRFLERNAARILKDKRAPNSDRPIWGRGLKVVSRRRPRGVVLVIGPGNYPLFLTGVQTLQAVAAGNAVLIKPAPGCSAPMQRLVEAFEASGAPVGLVQVLDESPAAAELAIDAGIDHVVLTGGVETGRKVLARAAEAVTPCTVELSGCDAVFVLPGADLERVADAIGFGLKLNGGATCIGPRRVFSTPDAHRKLSWLIRDRLPALGPGASVPPAVADQARRLVQQAVDDGAEQLGGPSACNANDFWPIALRVPTVETPLLHADLFAPVVSFVEAKTMDHALELSRRCPYALGASVFGPPAEAAAFAQQVEAGCVTVNDVIAPTADPRVAFGGWKQSGFGVTRGAEGLLEMTRLQTVVTQTARWLPHLDPPRPGLDKLLVGLLRMAHGKSLADRWRGLRDVIRNAKE